MPQTPRRALAARFFPLLLALLTLIAAGCNGPRTDKLSSIVGDPARFVNKNVTVAGEVTKVYELPLGLANLAAYRINDGTGQVWILSRIGAPREGDKVGLKGTVRPEGRFGGTLLGSVIEEHERKIK